jgi:hypothetical protein
MSREVKQFVLSFQKNANQKVEAAAAFAFTELERSKGEGLLAKQPVERTVFLSKIGYPLWLIPKNRKSLIFNGLDHSIFTISYTDVFAAKEFLSQIKLNAQPLDKYLVLLTKYGNILREPLQQKKIELKGLIADSNFREEFSVHSREAEEYAVNQNFKLVLLESRLDEEKICSTLSDLDLLISSLKEEADAIAECIKLIKKTTALHKTEIDYKSLAAKEEIDAKIKAQKEIVNPQIAKTNKLYKRRIREISKDFDKEIRSQQKKQEKALRVISATQRTTNVFLRKAKLQAEKGHLVYERHWKEKAKRAESNLGELKRKLTTIKDSIEKLTKQKVEEVHQLQFQLDSELKRIQQPVVGLEKVREEKVSFFRKEILNMTELEDTVIEGLNKNLKNWDSIAGLFDLGVDEEHDNPVLFYLPFYVACYISNEKRRFFTIPPLVLGGSGLSSKLKGAFGISTIKDALSPRFNSNIILLQSFQDIIKHDPNFESLIYDLGQKNNLLPNSDFRSDVVAGLDYLKRLGWLSGKLYQTLIGWR